MANNRSYITSCATSGNVKMLQTCRRFTTFTRTCCIQRVVGLQLVLQQFVMSYDNPPQIDASGVLDLRACAATNATVIAGLTAHQQFINSNKIKTLSRSKCEHLAKYSRVYSSPWSIKHWPQLARACKHAVKINKQIEIILNVKFTPITGAQASKANAKKLLGFHFVYQNEMTLSTRTERELKETLLQNNNSFVCQTVSKCKNSPINFSHVCPPP